MRRLALAVAIAGVLQAGPGDAAPKSRAPPKPAANTTTVEGLEVRPVVRCLDAKRQPGSVAPRLVSSYPSEGAVVRPGLLVVRLTFNQPMTCSGHIDEVPPLPGPCPRGVQSLSLSLDRRSIRTVCQLAPDTAYALRASENVSPLVGLHGKVAEPFQLTFRTSSEPPIATIPEALAQDPAWRPPAPR